MIGVNDLYDRVKTLSSLILITLVVHTIAQDGSYTFDPSSVDLTTKVMFSRFFARSLRPHLY